MIIQKPKARHLVIFKTAPRRPTYRMVAPWLGDLTAFAMPACPVCKRANKALD
jgi:hypothetical protein